MPEFHRREAVATNQRAWELLAKDERTPDDDVALLNAAHASAYHWRVIGSPVNWQRADWLVSRVYCVLGWGEQAMVFAQRCLELTEQEGFDGFDVAYAYEAVARASAARGDLDLARVHYDKAKSLGDRIEDPHDREIFETDLTAEPWFGLRR